MGKAVGKGEIARYKRIAKLQYMINVCAKFQYNPSKTVGGVRDTESLVFCTQTGTRTDKQDESSKHSFCRDINIRYLCITNGSHH